MKRGETIKVLNFKVKKVEAARACGDDGAQAIESAFEDTNVGGCVAFDVDEIGISA